MTRFRSSRGAWLALALLVALPAAAQDKPAQPPQMSPEEAAMMERWNAYMTPGEPHKRLAEKVGTWTAKVTQWMAPDAPPTTSEAVAEYRMILDGRFLADSTQGSFQGIPFLGNGLTGYDNMKKVYQSTWIDNMGTGIMMSEGTYDAASKSFTFHGEMPDPMTGKMKKVKSVDKPMGPDQSMMQMWETGPDGKPWKSLEIVYTRKK
jgi:hypothetical protein